MSEKNGAPLGNDGLQNRTKYVQGRRQRGTVPLGSHILSIANALLLVLITLVSGCEAQYNLNIENRSDEIIILRAVSVDGLIIATPEIDLQPIGEKYSPMGSSLYRFSSVDPKILELVIKDKFNPTDLAISCRLIDYERAGCLFKASIRNHAVLTCACDSYSDFSK